MQDINSVVSQNIQNASLSVAKATAKTVGDVNKILLSLLLALAQKQREEKRLNDSGEVSLKKIYEAVKKGEVLKSVCVADEDYELFKKHLNKQGVLFSSTDFNKDDSKMILFLEKDDFKVKNAISSMQAERGLITELSPELFCKNSYDSKEKISVLKNIDQVELELFRHYSQQEKLVFSTVKNSNDVKVLFKKTDVDKVNSILKKVSSDLTSSHSDLIRKQIEYKLAGRQQMNIAFEDVKKEFYIVDSKNPGNYLHIDSEKMVYVKNGKEITSISRDRHDFMEQCYAKINCLTEPVLLTPEEFKLPLKENKRVIKHKTDIFPTGYDLVKQEMEKKKLRAWEIKNEKLSLDNGYQLENSSDIENPDVSYSEFLANEVVNDQHDIEELEKHSTKYAEKFEIKDVVVKKHSLEYYITESTKTEKQEKKEITHIKEEVSI